ncbi:restriction endonuclease subunit S [Rhizobium ruizarguesonis]
MSELPKGWVEATLASIFVMYQPETIAKSELKADGLYPVYGANGVIGTYDRYNHEASELLVTCRGATCGAVNVTVPRSWINGNAMVVRPSEGVMELRWAEYFFRGVADYSKIITGTAQPQITRQNLDPVLFPLPPLAEQKRIVAKLDALSAKSARARTELARIETLVSRYKQAVLSKAFSGELTAAEISSWALCTLGDLALDVRYGTAEKCTYAPDLTPVLRIPNVANGRIDLSDLKHASFNEKELRKLALVEGDLLVIRSNGSVDLVGRSAIVDSAAANMLFAGYLIRIRLDLTNVLPLFIQYWMQSFAVRRTIEDAAKSTSGVNNVNSQQLQALQLQLPPLEEQHEIVRRIESTFARIDRLAGEAGRALKLLGKLDQAILAKAFRGELVPQDKNDEPAEKLLERIHAEREASPKATRPTRSAPSKLTKSKRRTAEMAKTRGDVEKDHLAEILRVSGGTKTPRDLWLQSGMDIDEFYKQLRSEMDLGQIREGTNKDQLELVDAH